MKIKIEKKLKRFLKQHKAYKRFRKCVHLYNEPSTSENRLIYHKGRRNWCVSILSSFVIDDISSNQQEIDFWWNLHSQWLDYCHDKPKEK